MLQQSDGELWSYSSLNLHNESCQNEPLESYIWVVSMALYSRNEKQQTRDQDGEGTECGPARINHLAWVAAKYTVMEMSSISVHS